MKSHHISVTKTARYWTYGNLSEKTESIWFVCHGYGQLAEYFIKNFEILDAEKHFIVAPEALSKFYTKGFDGRVGATWMTKEDRLAEIEDYINYLNTLYQYIEKHSYKPFSQLKIKVLGFSQGTSTVMRWICNQHVKVDTLIIWAGAFPHDLDYNLVKNYLNDIKIYYIYGKSDEMIQQPYFESQILEIRKKIGDFEIITFDGKHELNEEIILRFS